MYGGKQARPIYTSIKHGKSIRDGEKGLGSDFVDIILGNYRHTIEIMETGKCSSISLEQTYIIRSLPTRAFDRLSSIS